MKSSLEIFKNILSGSKEKSLSPPIWMMRQAGRYMAEYRELRKKWSFMDLCHQPELAAEITMQPIRTFDMDAAILFCDILVTGEALGVGLDIVDKKGPVFHKCIENQGDIDALRNVDDAAGSLDFVAETLKLCREQLGQKKALLGFLGAPLTVASYMIEGKSSNQLPKTFAMISENPKIFHQLMEKLTDLSILYIQKQREVGVEAIQIFESWASLLPRDIYLEAAFPYLKRLVESCAKEGEPLIMFALADEELWKHFAKLPVQVLSIDAGKNLPEFRSLYPDKVLQGNMEPRWLLTTPEKAAAQANILLDSMEGDPSWIFNLGHGIQPPTSPDAVRAVVEAVQSRR